ncbi:hypothetical protein RV010_002238 [Escherichia coli]|nr:hypothetical protein [Escherichia coli]EIK8723797.1 hypothetical protein [Escherichia coli]EIL8782577.1 hypothetical protein [Escherichia coli]ELK8356837.1 hypothetical protein [Escherichia coli]
MNNNKRVICELNEFTQSAISYNNAVSEIINVWFESLTNCERDESTTRLTFAISELLNISTSKIESISEKINGLSGHAIGE